MAKPLRLAAVSLCALAALLLATYPFVPPETAAWLLYAAVAALAGAVACLTLIVARLLDLLARQAALMERAKARRGASADPPESRPA